MPILPYREPKLFQEIRELIPFLQEMKIQKVLIVTGNFLKKTGATIPLETALEQGNIQCVIYHQVRPNPTVENVEYARKLYMQENCQGLIAFGGGSAIDCAKAIGAGVVYPERNLRQMKGLLRVTRKLPPLAAIPTTAGTGSEVTIAAVITDEERHDKYAMNNFTFIPQFAVLDPKVTVTMPPSLTATTGMDALTHAVEAYIGRSTTKETRTWAKQAVNLIFEYLEIACQDGTNIEARKNMLQASYLAGRAFSQSYVGYVHAIAHSLGGQYNIPHGLANAVLLTSVLESYGPCVHRKLHELAVVAGVATEEDSPETGAGKLIAAIKRKNARLGIPETLAGIREEDIPALALHAAREANPLYPVPRLMDARELESIFESVLEKKPS